MTGVPDVCSSDLSGLPGRHDSPDTAPLPCCGRNPGDLVSGLPARYEDEGILTPVADCLFASIGSPPTAMTKKAGLCRFTCEWPAFPAAAGPRLKSKPPLNFSKPENNPAKKQVELSREL